MNWWMKQPVRERQRQCVIFGLRPVRHIRRYQYWFERLARGYPFWRDFVRVVGKHRLLHHLAYIVTGLAAYVLALIIGYIWFVTVRVGFFVWFIVR